MKEYEHLYDFKIEELPTLEESVCTGLVFKGRINTFFDGKRVTEKKTVSLLKRKSCTCPECSYILESLVDYDFLSCSESFLDLIEDNILYTIQPHWEVEDSGEGWGTFHSMTDFTFVKIIRKHP